MKIIAVICVLIAWIVLLSEFAVACEEPDDWKPYWPYSEDSLKPPPEPMPTIIINL